MASFNEVGRVHINNSREVVISEVVDENVVMGININSFVVTNKYTGFTKGVFVPVTSIKNFNKLVDKACR